MHLIYLDESGNSGNNLNHTQQPIFVLSALLVPETEWLPIESELAAEVNRFFPTRPDDFEIHASEIINPRGFFRAFPVQTRLDFYKALMDVAARHKLRVIHRAIIKKRYLHWLEKTFGAGVVINPHLAAFPLVAHVVNDFLRQLPGKPLGIFISDENRDVAQDVEKSQRILRGTPGRLHLSQIIEKGFFIDSRKSLLLQLCDLCAHALRRLEEKKAGITLKPLHEHCIPLVKPLIHRGTEALPDVLAWLESEQKKERPGT